MEDNQQNKDGSTGSYVEYYSTDHTINAQGAGIPVYEKYKGKHAEASGEWKPTKGEKTALYILMGVMILIFGAAAVTYFMPVPTGVKIIVLIATIVIMIGGIGGFLLIVNLRHNKKDPMEMHYYDVDYEINHITKTGYDNTKEITKEEFYSDKSKNRGKQDE